MAEGGEPLAREWQRGLGLQDCMVLVGGRLDIPDFEPIPITNDSMCSAVEILWSRPRPGSQAPAGKSHQNGMKRWSYPPSHLDRFCIAMRVPWGESGSSFGRRVLNEGAKYVTAVIMQIARFVGVILGYHDILDTGCCRLPTALCCPKPCNIS
jgi:hypothetical protein